MPVNENGNERVKNTTVKAESNARSSRKAPGTRLGTLNDWRGASGKSGEISSPHGRAIRDGR
jgi:hypothetical protein